LVGPTDPAFGLQLVRRGIPPKALKRRDHTDRCAIWWAQGKAAPVAWVVGADPASQSASIAISCIAVDTKLLN